VRQALQQLMNELQGGWNVNIGSLTAVSAVPVQQY
jgi:hypothetical protein